MDKVITNPPHWEIDTSQDAQGHCEETITSKDTDGAGFPDPEITEYVGLEEHDTPEPEIVTQAEVKPD